MSKEKIDCLHYDVCSDFLDTFAIGSIDNEFSCVMFSDKSELVHLPCKVGDTIYFDTYKMGENIGVQHHKVGKVEVIVQQLENLDVFGRPS